jgi:hypothetical protein
VTGFDWHAEPVGRLIVGEYDRAMTAFEHAETVEQVVACVERVFEIASAFRQVRRLLEDLGELELES